MDGPYGSTIGSTLTNSVGFTDCKIADLHYLGHPTSIENNTHSHDTKQSQWGIKLVFKNIWQKGHVWEDGMEWVCNGF